MKTSLLHQPYWRRYMNPVVSPLHREHHSTTVTTKMFTATFIATLVAFGGTAHTLLKNRPSYFTWKSLATWEKSLSRLKKLPWIAPYILLNSSSKACFDVKRAKMNLKPSPAVMPKFMECTFTDVYSKIISLSIFLHLSKLFVHKFTAGINDINFKSQLFLVVHWGGKKFIYFSLLNNRPGIIQKASLQRFSAQYNWDCVLHGDKSLSWAAI